MAIAIDLMLARLTRLWRRPAIVPAPNAAPVLPQPQTPAFDAAVDAIGMSTMAWSRRRRESAAVYPNVSPDALQKVRQHHAARTQLTISAGERLLRHEFELLGSGPYTPDDPDR